MIYESLNTVEEFPDYWEENLDEWANFINEMLKKTASDTETLIKIKKVSIDIVNILSFNHSEYTSKFT